MDRDAWIAGFRAGARGLSTTKCPHRPGTNESYSWHSGYIEGKAKHDGFGWNSVFLDFYTP
jgi:hypothetical protein